MVPAHFITFEGGDGAGKSTQVELLANAMQSQGITVVTTREPGGTPGAEIIRDILVNGPDERWLPMSDLLLFYAARWDHLQRLIRPALARQEWVISDRFADSTVAYQGYGRGVDRDTILEIDNLSLAGFKPDLTFIFDIDPQIGLARAEKRHSTAARYETMDVAFHHRLRAGFLDIAKRDSRRCVIIDAAQPVEDVHRAVMAEMKQRYGLDA